MKREELMINDIVFDYTNSPVKVCVVGQDIVVKNSFRIGSLEPNELSPIPLTEDILAKNEFTYEEDTFLPDTGYWSLSNEDGLLYFTINAFGVKGSGEVAFGYQDIALKYVHQLQHLLRLCGIEKELIID